MTPIHYQLRRKLQDAMERRCVTLADLARAVGVTPKYLERFMLGDEADSLQLWQDCFDALSYRVELKIVQKKRVII